MKHYRKQDGSIYAFESDGSQDAFIKADMMPISDAELAVLRQPTLADLKTAKLAQLDADYNTAVQQPVAYMGTTFQADAGSQSILTSTLVALNASGAVPAGFGWWDINNAKVPMTLAELNGLAGAMLAQGWAAFQHKQAKKDAAREAGTVAALEAVAW